MIGALSCGILERSFQLRKKASMRSGSNFPFRSLFRLAVGRNDRPGQTNRQDPESETAIFCDVRFTGVVNMRDFEQTSVASVRVASLIQLTVL